jgi:hypothetical protein
LPSSSSREAPPPVEMWLILSARPACSTAATESPPPMMVVAPAAIHAGSNGRNVGGVMHGGVGYCVQRLKSYGNAEQSTASRSIVQPAIGLLGCHRGLQPLTAVCCEVCQQR